MKVRNSDTGLFLPFKIWASGWFLTKKYVSIYFFLIFFSSHRAMFGKRKPGSITANRPRFPNRALFGFWIESPPFWALRQNRALWHFSTGLYGHFCSSVSILDQHFCNIHTWFKFLIASHLHFSFFLSFFLFVIYLKYVSLLI